MSSRNTQYTVSMPDAATTQKLTPKAIAATAISRQRFARPPAGSRICSTRLAIAENA